MRLRSWPSRHNVLHAESRLAHRIVWSRRGRGLLSRNHMSHKSRLAQQLPAVRTVLSAGLTSVLAATVGLLLTRLPAIAVLAALTSAAIPQVVIRRKRQRQITQIRDAWPYVVDALASSVRAGVPIAAALAECEQVAPRPLGRPLTQLTADIRTTGLVDASLRFMAADLDDEVSRRVILSLRTIHDLGGSRAAVMLTQLAAGLREQSRLLGEIEARRSWLRATAAIAVAAPWVTVLALASRTDTMRAYSSGPGTMLLLGAGLACLVGYVWMRRLGALPSEPRVIEP